MFPGISDPTFVLLSLQSAIISIGKCHLQALLYVSLISCFSEHAYDACESEKTQIEQIDLQLLISAV